MFSRNSDWWIEATGGRWTLSPNTALTGVSIDTRTLQPGNIFFCLRGERDGHDFAKAAVDAGAPAIVADRIPDNWSPEIPVLLVDDTMHAMQMAGVAARKQFQGKVIALTGSYGKTTTKDLLKHLLGPGTYATPGNFNNHLGVPLSLLGAPCEAPFLVFELGMNQPGEIARLRDWVSPDFCLVTGVGEVHLESMGSLEAIAEEKASIFSQPKESLPGVFPEDCMAYAAFRRRLRAWQLCEGRTPGAFWGWGHGGWEDPHVMWTCLEEGRVEKWDIPELSCGGRRNLALAILTSRHFGVEPEAIADRIRTWQPSPLRGRWQDFDGGRAWVDCYNANPPNFRDSLDAFVHLSDPGKTRCFVLGTMEELGAFSGEAHYTLGKMLPVRPGDRVALFGPGGEEMEKALRENGFDGQVFRDPGPEIDFLVEGLNEVFIKGSRRYRLENWWEGFLMSREQRKGLGVRHHA